MNQPNEASLANMHQVHKTAAACIMNSDESLSAVSHRPASDVQCLSLLGFDSSPLTGGTVVVKQRCAGSKGNTNNTHNVRDGGCSSQFPLVAKALKGCKDPVVAASKIRKATMREVGELESKAERGKQICRDVIGLFQDDFDSQELGVCAVGFR